MLKKELYNLLINHPDFCEGRLDVYKQVRVERLVDEILESYQMELMKNRSCVRAGQIIALPYLLSREKIVLTAMHIKAESVKTRHPNSFPMSVKEIYNAIEDSLYVWENGRAVTTRTRESISQAYKYLRRTIEKLIDHKLIELYKKEYKDNPPYYQLRGIHYKQQNALYD